MTAIPEWAADYVGLPYEAGGRTRKGVDCWGLINLVWAEQLGGPLPNYEGAVWRGPGDSAAVALGADVYAGHYVEVEPGAERLGDGLLLRMRGLPLHVGMVIAPGWMLHIEEGCNACLEPYRALRWGSRIMGIYRQRLKP